MLENIMAFGLSIWTLCTLIFWGCCIMATITKDIEVLEYIHVNNTCKLILGLLFPYIYVVVIMLYWVYKFFRNVFTIKWS